MKVRYQKKMLNREKVLASASQMYREFGLDGIGIRLLSNAVGLTHGSFYAQFPEGKKQLMSEALTLMFNEYRELLAQPSCIEDVIQFYLSAAHRQSVQDCCPIPTLSGDVSRHKNDLDDTYDQGIRRLLETLMAKSTQAGDSVSKERAMHILSSMVGSLTIARALKDGTLAEDFLHATQAALGAQ